MTGGKVATADLRYNDVRQKSTHNAFQRREGIADQFLYWRIRSMEVDLHIADVFDRSTKGDWAVYHDWHDPLSSVAKLSQFLGICRGLTRAVPDHEVLTIFLDMKDPFSVSKRANHSWAALDALLIKHLGRALYRPRNLLKRSRSSTSLRGSVAAAGWPRLEELQGKIIVVLTGSKDDLKNYATTPKAALDRAAFLSTPVDAAQDIPGGGDTVFFNLNALKHPDLVPLVGPLGYIARTYYVDKKHDWERAAKAGAHHLATDNVNERRDAWAATRNELGYPFERVDAAPIEIEERCTASGVWARSEDMWGRTDSFHFNYRRCSAGSLNATYQYAIASPNSHTDDFTKGAVMVRESLAPDAAYFAVVRIGEKHGLRVQFRPGTGDSTMSMGPKIGPNGLFGPDLAQDTIVHVRLKLDRGGKRARAWGSADRSSWTMLGRFEFDKPLRFHGLAVSSHGQRRGAKFLFVSPDPAAERMFEHDADIDDRSDQAGWSDASGVGRWVVDGFGAWRPPSHTPVNPRPSTSKPKRSTNRAI